MAAAQKITYDVLVGINFPPNDTRREPGETVTNDELPGSSVKWLLEQNIIQIVGTKAPAPAPITTDEDGE